VGASLYLMYSQRFSALLEAGLSAALHRPVEVLNFSVNGYGTLQEARLLETVVGQFDPDAVLVVYCMNDPAESLFPIGWFRDPDPPALYSLDLLGPGLRSLFGVPGERPLAPGEGPGGDAGPAWERAYERDGEGWRSVEEGLDRMTAWSEGAGVPLLVAVAPLLMEDDPAGRRTAGMRAQVLSALSERGLASIDLRPRLEALPLATITQWPGDIYHLSAAGHAAAADALLPRLQDLLESREN
jgi:lysophospholipase L1-like esterase